MLKQKHCHQGLQARARLFGLEIADLMLLFPGFYLVAAIFERPVVAAFMTVLGGIVLRIFKWRRLPGHTDSFTTYLLIDKEHPVLGYDDVPGYPGKITHV